MSATRAPTAASRKELWLCIHLQQLALDAVLRCLPPDNPTLDPAHVAVVEQRGSQRWIADVGPLPQRQGIYAGQGLAAAYALMPQLSALPRQLQAEQQGLIQVANWACQLSSRVCLRSPDMVLVEISGSLRLLGQNWRELIRQGVMDTGYRTALSAAPTAAASQVLARAGRYVLLKTLSPLPRSLQTLPLEALDLLPPTQTGIASLGISQLQELLAMPRQGLLRRFGRSLLEQLDQITGNASESLALYQPPVTFESSLELASEVHEAARLVFAVQRLLKELEQFLRARDQALSGFELGLEYSHGETQWLEFGLLELERDAQRLLSLSQERLHQLKLKAPVRRLSLRADRLFESDPVATDLFATAQPLSQLSRLLERLRSRLGDSAVYGLSGWADYRPEKATRPWRVNEAGRPGIETTNTRPIWILDQPEPLPACPGQIVTGPERIESGWWDGQDIRRDYYVVEQQPGRRLWVYQDCRSKAWFKHGLFS